MFFITKLHRKVIPMKIRHVDFLQINVTLNV
nr:MAG TPA: 50S ribosomal protein L2 [Crassvirales sp.]DAI34983.1 MAG TPA: 50S ribosomal protein L2 [Caudoviricetes sp.]